MHVFRVAFLNIYLAIVFKPFRSYAGNSVINVLGALCANQGGTTTGLHALEERAINRLLQVACLFYRVTRG